MSPSSFGPVRGRINRLWRNCSICGEKEMSRCTVAGAKLSAACACWARWWRWAGTTEVHGWLTAWVPSPRLPADLKPALLPNCILCFEIQWHCSGPTMRTTVDPFFVGVVVFKIESLIASNQLAVMAFWYRSPFPAQGGWQPLPQALVACRVSDTRACITPKPEWWLCAQDLGKYLDAEIKGMRKKNPRMGGLNVRLCPCTPGCGGKSAETGVRERLPGKWRNCSQLGVKALVTSAFPPQDGGDLFPLWGRGTPRQLLKQNRRRRADGSPPRAMDRVIRPSEASSPHTPTHHIGRMWSEKGTKMANRLMWRRGWQSQRGGAGCAPAAVQTGNKMALDCGSWCVEKDKMM